MEEINIQQLQHILTEDLFLIREEFDSATRNAINSQNGDKNQKSKSSKSDEDFITTKEPIHYEGKFENGVLILHEEEKLAPEVMDMLVKMINAVNHSMNEVGMISSKSLEGRSLEEFMDLNAHRVLKFGRIKHPINALPALDYTVHTEDETEFLFADSLTVISEDRALKVKLWESLKILFNISKK
ncbi:MAG: hypothetical protein P8O16_19050 [Algoriphagus sp.]|uniref:hypothetical protein n=1 Tax=Algoriphagus sp. TaxID=1872435 RepID=UPI00261585CC|nr:hypothetical protein [Algoriphagus sp.]MDG1279384.1 hypothetical protein [Algoriphagus sp.]